jgi:hypothetical protein
VSDYGLDDRAIEVRSPAETKDFSTILCVQTGSGAHPASCTMGTVGPFSGGKARPGRDADQTPSSNAEVKNDRSYISSSTKHLHGLWCDYFNFYFRILLMMCIIEYLSELLIG